eukprot:6210630-Pleurochrysis_carterae.AAC.1
MSPMFIPHFRAHAARHAHELTSRVECCAKEREKFPLLCAAYEEDQARDGDVSPVRADPALLRRQPLHVRVVLRAAADVAAERRVGARNVPQLGVGAGVVGADERREHVHHDGHVEQRHACKREANLRAFRGASGRLSRTA